MANPNNPQNYPNGYAAYPNQVYSYGPSFGNPQYPNANPPYPSPPIYNYNDAPYVPMNSRPNYVHPNQPIQQPFVVPLVSQRRQISRCGLIPFTFLVFIESIFYILMMVNLPWFSYCYWDFSLHEASARFGVNLKIGSGTYSISDFYSLICYSNYDFPECPELCTSISPLKTSMHPIVACISIGIVFAISALVIAWVKNANSNFKFSKFLHYFFNFMPLVFYIIGFAVYYSRSKFDENFKNTGGGGNLDSPVNFTWNFGLVACVVSKVIMAFNFLMSKITFGSLYV